MFVEQMGSLIASYEVVLAKTRSRGKRKKKERSEAGENDVLQLQQLCVPSKWSLFVSNTGFKR